MWWQIGIDIYISFAIYYDMACVHCHRLLTLTLQCCHQVDSDLTPDLPQDAKGHQTCDRCLYQSCRHAAAGAAVHQLHHLHHMAGKVRPPETRTGRLHQGRKTATLGNWTLHTDSSISAVLSVYLCSQIAPNISRDLRKIIYRMIVVTTQHLFNGCDHFSQ